MLEHSDSSDDDDEERRGRAVTGYYRWLECWQTEGRTEANPVSQIQFRLKNVDKFGIFTKLWSKIFSHFPTSEFGAFLLQHKKVIWS